LVNVDSSGNYSRHDHGSQCALERLEQTQAFGLKQSRKSRKEETMSKEQDKRLRAGEYYGRVVRRRRFSGVLLSELSHAQPRALPPHSHDLGFFSFLLKGDYEEWYGRRNVTHQPGMLMWHPAAMQHQDEVGGSGCHFFNAEVPPHWMERLREHASVISSPFVLPGADAGWVMMRLYREFIEAEDGCELALEGLLLELLATLARRPGPVERQKPLWLRRVETLIRDEFTGKLTMTALAGEAGVHPAHLAAVFRRFHRATVGEYVHRLRVQAACEMLRQSDLPMAEIALQLGFADQSHFSRVFRRLTGVSPNAWRNMVAI
jgi:AraC family transcriptional regulator